MDIVKIETALKILEERGLVKNSLERNRYLFTVKGRKYTYDKSEHAWVTISNGTSLWIREGDDDWFFKRFDAVTEDEFNDFCDYYGISDGPEFEVFDDLLEI